MQYILKDFHILQVQATPLFCDSRIALYLAENLVFHDKTKHIELDCNIIRDKCLAGIIKPIGISSTKQLTDAFTNPLAVAWFKDLTESLG